MALAVDGSVARLCCPSILDAANPSLERVSFISLARGSYSLAFPTLSANRSRECPVFCVRALASEDVVASDTSPVGSVPSFPPSPRPPQGKADPPTAPAQRGNSSRRTGSADSPDWVTFQITRRFGLGAGLAWVGFLAFGAISEQIKTRREAYEEEANSKDVAEVTEVVTPEGLRYTDLRLGGGATPQRGDLVLIALTGKVVGSEKPFVDTTVTGRDEVFIFGGKRYTGGVCEGLDLALGSMKVGGKRRVIVPPSLGFGKNGAIFGEVVVPEDATLEYEVQLKRASISPA